MKEVLVSLDQLAASTGLSKQTLNGYRYLGKGPKFLKLEGRIFYLERDIDDWVAEAHGRQNGTTTTTGTGTDGDQDE